MRASEEAKKSTKFFGFVCSLSFSTEKSAVLSILFCQGTIVSGHVLICWTLTSLSACYFVDAIRCVRSGDQNLAAYNGPLVFAWKLRLIGSRKNLANKSRIINFDLVNKEGWSQKLFRKLGNSRIRKDDLNIQKNIENLFNLCSFIQLVNDY